MPADPPPVSPDTGPDAKPDAKPDTSLGIGAVAALAEPTRRRVYDVVVDARRGLTRDEVADSVGLPRNTAAFHLDRLTDEGLLDATFERRTGRSGPGAGRPSKIYARSTHDVAVSLPPRHYDLAGELLASAVEESERTGEPVRTCLERQARSRGHNLASAGLETALTQCGYEPFEDAGTIALANCPFHELSTRHTALVCGMNLCLMEGLLEGAEETALTARLDPGPGRCCVRLEPA
jgi:predicted ArsR family transcriptional regulator